MLTFKYSTNIMNLNLNILFAHMYQIFYQNGCFILTNIQPLYLGSYWILLMLYNPFPRKDTLSIMLAAKVSSNTSKREETNLKTYHSLQQLQLSVFEYIEGFYNSKRGTWCSRVVNA